jgi:hypothetical protein
LAWESDWRLQSIDDTARKPALSDGRFAIEHEGRHFRQADFDFLMSQEAKDIVKEEWIVLLDYRPLQTIWKGQ